MVGPEESLLAGLAEISGPKDMMGPTFDSPKFLGGQVSMLLNLFFRSLLQNKLEQGSPMPEGEGSVPLTSLYYMVKISYFFY